MHSRRKIETLASGVHQFCSWWDIQVRSVLDVGAGVGYWSDWYRNNHQRAKVVSVDVSEHACKKYGHELRDISSWAPKRKFDLWRLKRENPEVEKLVVLLARMP